MTDSSLGQSARPTRLGRTVITGAVGLDRFPGTRVKGRYSIDLGELRRRFEDVGRTSARREFATGFVDFLLGRGARHS
jgi:hypothetical protein